MELTNDSCTARNVQVQALFLNYPHLTRSELIVQIYVSHISLSQSRLWVSICLINYLNKSHLKNGPIDIHLYNLKNGSLTLTNIQLC